MYVEIFSDCLVDSKDIVGIFDLDNTTTNRYTTDFLNRLRAENRVTYLVSDIQNSFILMADGPVDVAEMSSRKLKKRFEII